MLLTATLFHIPSHVTVKDRDCTLKPNQFNLHQITVSRPLVHFTDRGLVSFFFQSIRFTIDNTDGK